MPITLAFGEVVGERTIPPGACHLCEMDPAETVRPGGRPICHACDGILWKTCEECGVEGRRSFSRFGIRWWVANDLRARFWTRYRNRLVTDAPFVLSDSAAHYARRIADDPRVTENFGFGFFGGNGNDAQIHQTTDDFFLCDDCCHFCAECDEPTAVGHGFRGDLCEGCAMPRCGDCGEAWDTEAEADGCCAGEGVLEWDFRPEFVFWAVRENELFRRMGPNPDDLYLGIELETEEGADSFPDFLAQANETVGDPSFCYGKRDGSLDETGVELVTMPATLDAFRRRFPWQALAAWNDNGARSFYRGSCGFHIHASRSFFTPTHLWRFVAFQMRNQPLCEAVAQRDSSRWARWQTLAEFGREESAPLSDVVKGKRSNGERYVAINFQNDETVELRYFRGNLRPEAILTRVEFVDAIARFTQPLSAADVMRGALSSARFAEWVDTNRNRYTALANWLRDNETEWEGK